MKVFLIGLPGCGKTTLGKKVSLQLNKTFVDLDEEIVKGEGQSIGELFANVGERNFREIEKKYLTIWCAHDGDFIMATGGGTPCFYDNMTQINKAGFSIFLDTTVSEIATRMMNTELSKRPLFAGQDVSTVAGRIQEMRMQRISFYTQAHVTFSGEDLTVQSLAEEILSLEG